MIYNAIYYRVYTSTFRFPAACQPSLHKTKVFVPPQHANFSLLSVRLNVLTSFLPLSATAPIQAVSNRHRVSPEFITSSRCYLYIDGIHLFSFHVLFCFFFHLLRVATVDMYVRYRKCLKKRYYVHACLNVI